MKRKTEKRELILNGDIFKVILKIATPLMIYDMCNFLYGIFDMMVVSSSGIGEVSSIVILEQIRDMVSTVGISFGLGGSIIVARKLGAKEDEAAKRSANTVFFITLVIALVTILVCVPFSRSFLSLFTVKEVIDSSLGYFKVQICSVALVSMNSVFIGLEKAKGNTSLLLILNCAVIIIKVGLTCLFIYGPFTNITVTWIAVATLLAQAFLFVVGVSILFSPKNIIRIQFKYIKLRLTDVKELMAISIPILIGKFLFSYGKVSISQMATKAYSQVAVGCLGLSNSINGIAVSVMCSFQDTASTIISQNYGSGNKKRVMETFRKLILINLVIASISYILLTVFNTSLIGFFTGSNEERVILTKIAEYERFSLFFLTLECAGMALLYGLGNTKFTMTVSMLKIFLFRLPPLYILIKLGVNYIASGYVMLISVIGSAFVAMILSYVTVRKEKMTKNDLEL